MADFILYFRTEGHFSLESGSVRNPFALRQCSADFTVGMNVNEANQLLAIFIGHPVRGFYLLPALNPRFEGRELTLVFRGRQAVLFTFDGDNHNLILPLD